MRFFSGIMQAPAERVEAAVREVAAARGALAARDSELARLHTQLAARSSELEEARWGWQEPGNRFLCRTGSPALGAVLVAVAVAAAEQ